MSRSDGKQDDGRDDGREGREAPLEVSGEEFRAAGHALVDRLADFIDGIRDLPVASGKAPDEVRPAVGTKAGLPDDGTEMAGLLEQTAELLIHNATFNGHPRFFGYITAAPAPIGVLGDFLASAMNPNVGSWSLAPAATKIEEQVVRWIAELIGYPIDAGGLLVSGGNAANFVAFLAARLSAGGEEVRTAGLQGGGAGRSSRGGVAGPGPFTIYGSAETHTWIEKAADLYGFGTDAVRWIETDDRYRIRMDRLEEAVRKDREEGRRPLMVIGTAGTTAVGAVDPLDAMADFCEREGIWFHVDGAYGAFAAALPLEDLPAGVFPGAPAVSAAKARDELARDLRAMVRADSVAVDPHKWLYAPLEAGCVLVRDRELLRTAFSYHPPYYHFGVEATNFVDYGPQNSRGFRALKVWLQLRHAGRNGYVRMIADDIRFARAIHEAAKRHPEIEAATFELSVATFRYVPEEWEDGESSDRGGDRYLDDLNEAILEEVERSGEAFVSKAVLDGRVYLRACIVNFRTELRDAEALPEIVARHGRAIHSGHGRQKE